ncbi:MAG: B12-binding domain-containing radical SAM protein [Anaerolineaceae bacterium]
MGKNKILLVNTLPRLDYWDINKEPLIGIPYGLLSIGTVLNENGFQVVIVDPQVDRNYLESVEENLEDCLFVGISSMTAGVASGLQISDKIKRINPVMPIVWGGVHPTLFPESTLSDPAVDIVVWGEGEETCLNLANALNNGSSLELVKGIGYKNNNHLLFTEKRGFLDLETLPLINYDLVDMEKYIYRDLQSLNVGTGKVKIMVIHSSRGCPYKCSFCINTHPSQKYRSKSAERLLLEVDQVVKKYNPDVIHLQDDNFFANKERVYEFFNDYKTRGYHFQWFSLTRANYFHNGFLTDEFVGSLAKSCLWLGMGVESGSDRIRKMINKDLKKEQIMAAVKILGKYDIPTGYAFMVGLPSETPEEIFESITFMEEIKKIHPSAEFTYQYYRPYPGSELYDTAVDAGYQPPQTLREWGENRDFSIGYSTLESLPWIRSTDLINYLLTVVHFNFINDDQKQSMSSFNEVFRIFMKLYCKISLNTRRKLNFWRGLKYELWLGNTVKGIFS